MKRIGVILSIGAILVAIAWYVMHGSIINTAYTLKLKENTPIANVIEELNQKGIIASSLSQSLIESIVNVKMVPAGRYELYVGMGRFQFYNKLKKGHQDPIQFTLSTATFVEEIAGRAGRKMQWDSAALMQYIYADTNMQRLGYTRDQALCLFLPNTHEIYWTSTVDKFVHKFHSDNEKYWNEKRREKAKSLGLSPNEVYILASLVQKEYSKKKERTTIASVLLNRLRIQMPLQVDATCKYATRDFAAKRVLTYHTSYASPYNTYKQSGLPPGPICVPERETIDAVLENEKHDYLYYCADPSLNGYHIFSKTLAEHENVALQYRQKLNQMKITK